MNGKWITSQPTDGAVRFVKRFNLDNAERITAAEIDVCGLGYFTLFINGKRVGNDWHTPALTDYGKRDLSKFTYPLFDELSHRTLYLTYDVAEYLRSGENVIEVIVGGGWYYQRHRQAEGRVDYSDRLVANFDLTVNLCEGETLKHLTDGSESYSLYPITFCNLFFGEEWDTRLFEEEPQEFPVEICENPPENLQKQTCPPDRIIREITPTLIRDEKGYKLYDCGENISGLVSLKVKGKRGDTVTLNFAEVLRNGEFCSITTGSTHNSAIDGRPQLQSDSFILNGREQTLCPMFVWHCFRYFEVLGEAEALSPTALVIHTDMPISSTFRCDNEILNWLYDSYIRTELISTHGSVPMDCPHRERLGYTGDGQITANACMTTLDSSEMYKKWIEDILDGQNKLNGHIQHTAPFMGGGGGPGGWGCAIVEVPYQHYRHFGDIEVLEKCYEPQKKWIEYMVSRSDEGLVVSEEEGGWCLGDWCIPKTERLSSLPNSFDKENLPEPFVNTCYLIYSLEKLIEIAEVLNRTSDIENYKNLAATCRRALMEKYLANGQYFGGSHGADAFSLLANIGNKDSLKKALVSRYETASCLDTGLFGTPILLEALFSIGRGDIALGLLSSEDTEIGYNRMKSAGATTLWEYLDRDYASNCHPMFGAPVAQLFEGLLGIRPKDFKSGYSEIIIEPCLGSKVKNAKGSLHTKWGKISLVFKVNPNETTLLVYIPEGVNAELRLTEGSQPLKSGETKITL